jgi:hypothetical protein
VVPNLELSHPLLNLDLWKGLFKKYAFRKMIFICHYYPLTCLRRWAFLEKPPVVQLLKSFPAFYGTRKFITVFKKALHWSLSSARLIQSLLFTNICRLTVKQLESVKVNESSISKCISQVSFALQVCHPQFQY